MTLLPEFSRWLTPRCYEPVDGPSPFVCGAIATRMRPVKWDGDRLYFCERHAAPGDERLPRELTYRRVHLQVDIFIVGAARNQTSAQNEAVYRLERACRDVGAVLEVQWVRSVLGRHVDRGGVPEGRGPSGGG
jgi:hypothetical protein